MPTALVILPSTTYRAADFVKAAEGLGIDLIVASENPPPFDMADRYLQIDCSDPEEAAKAIVSLGDKASIDGIVAADDRGVVTAAVAAGHLGLRGNKPSAAAATRDKSAQRRLMRTAEVPQPAFAVVDDHTTASDATAGLRFPVVAKPLDRAAGQGVLKVDHLEDLDDRIEQIRAIVGVDAPVIVEEYLEGEEVALEGLVSDGRLTTLTIFDKPEGTGGPAFAETILVTPTALDAGRQREVVRIASAAIDAIGIENGPVHVELMVDGTRVSVIEVAARSIGGLCSQALSFGLMGTTLETLILRNALGIDKPELRRETVASGVLMIPVPRSGIFLGIANSAAIREIPHVTGLEISARRGAEIHPPPVGDGYLGFVFAKAPDAAEVTRSLVAARELVEVEIS